MRLPELLMAGVESDTYSVPGPLPDLLSGIMPCPGSRPLRTSAMWTVLGIKVWVAGAFKKMWGPRTPQQVSTEAWNWPREGAVVHCSPSLPGHLAPKHSTSFWPGG